MERTERQIAAPQNKIDLLTMALRRYSALTEELFTQAERVLSDKERATVLDRVESARQLMDRSLAS